MGKIFDMKPSNQYDALSRFTPVAFDFSKPIDIHKSCKSEISYLKEVIREKDEKIAKLESKQPA